MGDANEIEALHRECERRGVQTHTKTWERGPHVDTSRNPYELAHELLGKLPAKHEGYNNQVLWEYGDEWYSWSWNDKTLGTFIHCVTELSRRLP